MEITFKPADASHFASLLEMMQELCAHERLPFNEDVILSSLRKIVTDASLGRVYLMLADEQTAGYVVLTLGFSLEYHGRDAFIDEIYVKENYRRQGIGKRCLQFVEGVCREIGVKALHLAVDRTNTKAQAVYRGAGFIEQDRYLMTKWVD
ncbi:MAG: GNAT family N-acetyltransferase [Pyrinomonadaceae bacterium]|nr:GNAT family N-acetyltransferase [Pyrinomonadaceae bacterium]